MQRSIVLFLLLAFSVSGFAQKKLLSPKAYANGKYVEVTYGQPSKRNRVIFGGLVPYDTVWRTGANEATEITFKKNAVFGGKKIKAGTYTLFTIPHETHWDIILNSQLGQWGAYEYEKYKSKNVLTTTALVYELEEVLEKLTVTIKKDAVTFEWDKTGISVPYSLQ